MFIYVKSLPAENKDNKFIYGGVFLNPATSRGWEQYLNIRTTGPGDLTITLTDVFKPRSMNIDRKIVWENLLKEEALAAAPNAVDEQHKHCPSQCHTNWVYSGVLRSTGGGCQVASEGSSEVMKWTLFYVSRMHSKAAILILIPWH